MPWAASKASGAGVPLKTGELNEATGICTMCGWFVAVKAGCCGTGYPIGTTKQIESYQLSEHIQK